MRCSEERRRNSRRPPRRDKLIPEECAAAVSSQVGPNPTTISRERQVAFCRQHGGHDQQDRSCRAEFPTSTQLSRLGGPTSPRSPSMRRRPFGHHQRDAQCSAGRGRVATSGSGQGGPRRTDARRERFAARRAGTGDGRKGAPRRIGRRPRQQTRMFGAASPIERRYGSPSCSRGQGSRTIRGASAAGQCATRRGARKRVADGMGWPRADGRTGRAERLNADTKASPIPVKATWRPCAEPVGTVATAVRWMPRARPRSGGVPR